MIGNLDIFDPAYTQKVQIKNRQLQAIDVNNLRKQLFQTAVTAYVNSQGKAAYPQVPTELIVNDDGSETDNTLMPGLNVPSLGIPVASSGSLRPVGSVPPDRTDQIIAILGVLNGKLDQLLAK